MERAGKPHVVTALQVACSIAAGTAALLVLGLQPLLYGAYVAEGSIPDYRLGLLSAVEVFAIAAGSAVAIRLLRTQPVLPVAVVGTALLCLGNLLVAGNGNTLELFLIRLLAGSGGGLLVGLGAAAIATTPRIGFWAGAFLFGQASSQYSVMRWFAANMPGADSTQVQHALVAAGAAVLLLLPFLPRRLELHEADAPKLPPPSARGLIGLAAMFCFVGGAGGVWGYLELWLHSVGVAQPQAVHVLSIALLGQILGSVVGALMADGRWAWLRLLLAMFAYAGIIAVLMVWPGSVPFALIFGIIYMLAAPALSSLLHAIDPGHGSVPYAATAQLAGVSIIPTLAGETLAAHSLTNVLIACGAVIGFSGLLVATQVPWLLAASRRAPEVRGPK